MIEIIPGKRYRFTAVVTADCYGHIDLDWGVYDAVAVGNDETVTVELLPDPLPTTPGSVIRTTQRPCTYVRLRDGSRETSTWINEYGMGRSDEDMKNWGFTVLFDAGAKE